jgi:hypothetical protein
LPKAKLFSAVIDLDCKIDTSDVYCNTWASDYLKMTNILYQSSSRFLHLEVGESFSLALNDDLKILSWGINDCF